MLGEILTSIGCKSQVAGRLAAMILFVLVKMLELSANETPANKVEKVTQPIKKINMTKALWVLIGISYIARNIEHSRPGLFAQDIMPLDLCFYSRLPKR